MSETYKRLQSLQMAILASSPAPRTLLADDGKSIKIGQIWNTVEKDFRVMVIREMEEGYPLVVPIFDNTEMASSQDWIVHKSVLGYRFVMSMGSCFTLTREELRECIGRVPDNLVVLIETQWKIGQDIEKHIPLVSVGLEYLDEKDVRWKFHEDLLIVINRLVGPALMKLLGEGDEILEIKEIKEKE